jgi:Mrp family chromosome partitioning ATPase
VLIVDADLRYPTIHFHANRENVAGLADVLDGSVALDDAIVNIAPGFDALTAGKIPQHPVRLLDSPAFDELLKTVSNRYSMVIIDTSAFVPVADAKLVASRVDATVVVLSSLSSNEKAAAAFVAHFRALGIDNMLGVILNRTTPEFIDYSDYIATSHLVLPSASV